MPIKRRKRKIKVKFHKYLGLKCQGKKELRFLKECERYKREIPTKPKRIKTPYGYYTPDFELTDKLIEIKSLHTFKVCRGELSYKNIGTNSDKQWKKINYVAKNIKPLQIIIYFSSREKVIDYSHLEKPYLTIIIKGGYKLKK